MLFILFSWYLSSRDLQKSLRPAVLKSTSHFLRSCSTHGNFPSLTPARERKQVGPADVRWGWGRKWETDTAGDKASPACPGLCLSLVSGCGGCARQRHTWHSNRPVKEQLRQRWDGGAWAHRGLVIPGWFTHWGEWQGTLKGFSHYA